MIHSIMICMVLAVAEFVVDGFQDETVALAKIQPKVHEWQVWRAYFGGKLPLSKIDGDGWPDDFYEG